MYVNPIQISHGTNGLFEIALYKYIKFLIRTAHHGRAYHNISALIKFIEFKFKNNSKDRHSLIDKIKDLNIRAKDSIKYIKHKPLND